MKCKVEEYKAKKKKNHTDQKVTKKIVFLQFNLKGFFYLSIGEGIIDKG